MKAATSNHSKDSIRILLVDDNGLGLIARKTVLEELGYKISPHSSPHEALEHFSQQKFDLVITDYKMPRMNGLQLIERIREREPSIPIILLSGFVDALGLDEASSGADIVIQKSANEVTHLIRSVSRLLQRKAPRKPAAAQQSQATAKHKTL